MKLFNGLNKRIQGEDFTKAGDVYSFSMVLYQLLTQRLLSIDSDFYQFIIENVLLLNQRFLRAILISSKDVGLLILNNDQHSMKLSFYLRLMKNSKRLCHSKSILHRNIKAENVLVNDEFTPKLSDFGLSITLDEIAKATKTPVRGTPTHMAPEIWESSTYTAKSDVYAYGFTVYEIITNEIPFKDYRGIYQVIHDVVDLKKRPEFQESIPQYYKQLIAECWAHDPADRPTFKEILKRLKENAAFINSISADPDDFLQYADIFDPPSTPVEESTLSSQEVKLDGLKISHKQQELPIEKDNPSKSTE